MTAIFPWCIENLLEKNPYPVLFIVWANLRYFFTCRLVAHVRFPLLPFLGDPRWRCFGVILSLPMALLLDAPPCPSCKDATTGVSAASMS